MNVRTRLRALFRATAHRFFARATPCDATVSAASTLTAFSRLPLMSAKVENTKPFPKGEGSTHCPHGHAARRRDPVADQRRDAAQSTREKAPI